MANMSFNGFSFIVNISHNGFSVIASMSYKGFLVMVNMSYMGFLAITSFFILKTINSFTYPPTTSTLSRGL